MPTPMRWVNAPDHSTPLTADLLNGWSDDLASEGAAQVAAAEGWANSVAASSATIATHTTQIAALPATYAAPKLMSGITPYAPGVIHGGAKVLIIIGSTGTGRIWARDASGGNLSTSDDWGVTWKHGAGFPANTTTLDLGKVVQQGAYFYATLKDLTSGLWGVYRAPAVAQGTAYTWSAQVFTYSAVDITNTIRTCLAADAVNVYVGEYTLNAALGSKVWKSSDNGATWTVAYDVNSVGASWRHIHGITVDPYNAGHVYVSVGDNNSPVSVARSTDYGVTWETVLAGAPNNPWQSVQISFSPEWVWLASDRIGLDVVVFNRDDKIPYSGASGWHYNLPVVPPLALADRYYQVAYWGAVDPTDGSYHFVANDTSSAGNSFGYFRVRHVGAPVELVQTIPTGLNGGEVFIGGGYVWIGQYRWPTIAVAQVPAGI